MNRIIYKDKSGTLCVVIPTEEALKVYGIKKIAVKDVPFGLKFKIISSEDIPLDRSERDAWTVEDLELSDGVGGEGNEFN